MMPEDSSNSRVIWHGPLDDQHELRVERTAENEGFMFVAASGTGSLVLIHSVLLPATATLSEDDIAALKSQAKQAIAELGPVQAHSSSWEDDEAWTAKMRALGEMIAANPLDTFTIRWEYSATGEGLTTRLFVALAHTEDEALAQYRQHFHRSEDDAAWEYWSRGAEVRRGLHIPWLERLLNPDWLGRISTDPMYHRVIAFEWHFNAS